jgi:hypothetical protein
MDPVQLSAKTPRESFKLKSQMTNSFKSTEPDMRFSTPARWANVQKE